MTRLAARRRKVNEVKVQKADTTAVKHLQIMQVLRGNIKSLSSLHNGVTGNYFAFTYYFWSSDFLGFVR